MTDLPEPLVPEHVDLTDFPFMPLMIARLKQSRAWLLCKRRPEMAFYLLNIWTAAWHGRPAASLEDDDLVLADVAMCSDTVWQEFREDVLRGWVKCSDGRLYHPIIAEQAMAAWERKKAQRSRTAAATAARAAKRAEGQKERDDQRNVERDEHRDEDVTSTKGQGQGQGDNTSSLRSDVDHRTAGQPRAERKPRKHPYPSDAFERWYADYPHKVGRKAAEKAFAKVHAGDAVAFSELIDGLRRYRQTKPHDRPWCNPATWLNEGRWADAPASSTGSLPLLSPNAGQAIDFGNGCSAPPETIRKVWGSGRWPHDWGPKPGENGCRIPPAMAAELAGEHAA